MPLLLVEGSNINFMSPSRAVVLGLHLPFIQQQFILAHTTDHDIGHESPLALEWLSRHNVLGESLPGKNPLGYLSSLASAP